MIGTRSLPKHDHLNCSQSMRYSWFFLRNVLRNTLRSWNLPALLLVHSLTTAPPRENADSRGTQAVWEENVTRMHPRWGWSRRENGNGWGSEADRVLSRQRGWSRTSLECNVENEYGRPSCPNEYGKERLDHGRSHRNKKIWNIQIMSTFQTKNWKNA